MTTAQQKKMQQAFLTDVGIAFGARDTNEALQKGTQAFGKFDKKVQQIILQAWAKAQQNPSKQEGDGPKAIVAIVQKIQKAQAQTDATTDDQDYSANPDATESDETLVARAGAKLLKIAELNGHCPAGYQIQEYRVGGCVKCAKGRVLDSSIVNIANAPQRVSQTGYLVPANDSNITRHYRPSRYGSPDRDQFNTPDGTVWRSGDDYYMQPNNSQETPYDGDKAREKWNEAQRQFNDQLTKREKIRKLINSWKINALPTQVAPSIEAPVQKMQMPLELKRGGRTKSRCKR